MLFLFAAYANDICTTNVYFIIQLILFFFIFQVFDYNVPSDGWVARDKMLEQPVI